MSIYSLTGDFFALLVLFILYTRYFLLDNRDPVKDGSFRFYVCLVMPIISILTNIVVTVSDLYLTEIIHVYIRIILNSLYFIVTGLCSTMYAYCFIQLFDKNGRERNRIARTDNILFFINLCFAVAVLVNPFTHILFYYDETGHYTRGIFNRFIYLLPAIDIIVIIVFHLQNKLRISTAIKYIIKLLPIGIFPLIIVQLLIPEMFMNGMICAVSSLILFISSEIQTSSKDFLTGAGSYSSFITEISHGIKGGRSVQIISIYLRDFANINIRYGRHAGDTVLCSFSDALSEAFGSGRTFRIGNVTFSVVLPCNSSSEADKNFFLAMSIINRKWNAGNGNIILNTGISEYRSRPGETNTETIHKEAGFIVDESKSSIEPVKYDRHMRNLMHHRQDEINLLKDALQYDLFEVWFQPIYDVKTKAFTSAEALMRLKNYEGNYISPDRFISLAEENGLIIPVTEVVLKKSLELLSSGSVPQLESISVNFSMQQLLDPELDKYLVGLVAFYGLTPDNIKIEITERFMLHDADYAKVQMQKLVSAGFELYMDDFGTGYSNISGILTYPFSTIKIDRSLIKNIPSDDLETVFTSRMIQLMHDLGKTLVMEGVETPEQADFCIKNNADMIQGRYYTKPVPAEDLMQKMKLSAQQRES